MELDAAMTSNTSWLWLPSSQYETWESQAFTEIQEKEHDRGNTTVIPATYLHIKENIQKDHGNKNYSIVHVPFLGVSADLFSLLDAANVTIKCRDELKIVSKCILATTSPTFEAMFSDSAFENSKCVVLVDDFDPEIASDLVVFLNSGEVKNLSVSKACDLLRVAEKYQFLKLKDVCCEFLKPILTNVDFRSELPYVSKSTFVLQKARNESICD